MRRKTVKHNTICRSNSRCRRLWISLAVYLCCAFGLVGGLWGTDPAPTDVMTPVPLPKRMPAPKDNLTTPEKVALGRQLFFDPRLSGDNSMSCATCHLADKGFADGRKTAKGHRDKVLTRNTPGLLNVGLFSSLFWDGRAADLEEQALGPIENPDEMHQDLSELEGELAAVPGYVEQFRKIFGTTVNRQGIARALAAFQRTLVARDSPFDRYLAGDEEALSAEAHRGMELFFGEAECVRCHNGPLLSDGRYYRLGVSFADKGRGEVTGKTEHDYQFRTPSLRNIAQTAPYMHDGSQATLTDVVTFYYRQAPIQAPDGLSMDIAPMYDRSFSEIFSLVAFLNSLSGKVPEVAVPELP